MIPERSLEVLRAIVKDYVATREPVGSKSLLERHGFGVSSATIRNDMAILEEEELIQHTHTSSGRVPTDKGYRLFVNRLNEVKPLSSAEKHAIESFLAEGEDLDDLLSRTIRLLSRLTNQVAMVQYPSLGKANVRHIDFVRLNPNSGLLVLLTDTGRVQQRQVLFSQEIDEELTSRIRGNLLQTINSQPMSQVASLLTGFEARFESEVHQVVAQVIAAVSELIESNRKERVLLSGTSQLVRVEQDFSGNITPVLEAIEEQVVLLKLINEMQTEQHGVSVKIGRENPIEKLSGTAVITTGYQNSSGEIAKLGLIGPTRMDYSQNISAVLAVARYLSKTFE